MEGVTEKFKTSKGFFSRPGLSLQAKKHSGAIVPLSREEFFPEISQRMRKKQNHHTGDELFFRYNRWQTRQQKATNYKITKTRL